MSLNLAQTICELTRDLCLNHRGMVMGQCLMQAGNVAGTVPELTKEQGLLELPMADVMGSGIAVGYALDGRPTIYVVRYQGFLWFNAANLVNFAAKAREMWGYSLPLLIRAIASDGSIGPTIGPVASCSQHGMFYRMPGIPICAPMTPGEYRQIWKHFRTHNNPLFVDEYRTGYPVDYEMSDIILHPWADITLFPISSTRLNAIQAAKELEKEDIRCNLVHLVWLKPMLIDERIINPLKNSNFGGLVLDTDFEDGTAKCIAFDIMHASGKPVRVLGLEERCAGFAAYKDNPPPSAEKIYHYVKKIVHRTA